MSESTATTSTPEQEPACESPPAAPMPPAEATPDPRARLLQLAGELARSQNRHLLAEFLRLRRAI